MFATQNIINIEIKLVNSITYIFRLKLMDI